MADLLFVFAYDILEDRRRARVADLLQEKCARVQQSVFEGRMRPAEARALAAVLCAILEKGDKLRVYPIPDDALDRAIAFGGSPLPERQEFWLL